MDEVETVSAAFQEHNDFVLEFADEGVVTEYQQAVARWHTVPQSYRASRPDTLVKKLRYLADTTEERVDALLDNHDDQDRIEKCARRYRLGNNALRLLQNITTHSSVESD